ncbi:MAG: hypothetical protein RLZZ511_974 [Cyanobacteriota bacterium]|jgi:hypothetical protein
MIFGVWGREYVTFDTRDGIVICHRDCPIHLNVKMYLIRTVKIGQTYLLEVLHMPKLHSDPIGEQDLIEFLDSTSDFSFELETLQALNRYDFQCEHGGTYIDHATSKSREFDIRAHRRYDQNSCLWLAVECKNLRENFPLLISCIPRKKNEAFHEVLYSETFGTYGKVSPIPGAIRNESLYPRSQYVGKSCDQVGRTADKRDISSGDSEVYEKWSQALSSAEDLTIEACKAVDLTHDEALAMVIPILVVPNGRLWQVDFSEYGERISDPRQVDRCSYFIGKTYTNDITPRKNELTISHLEFVTLNGLAAFMNSAFSGTAINETFAYTQLRI